MNIGQVSKQTDLSAKMIRYYEEIGLLKAVQRTAVGYRIYNTHHLQTLRFIRHAKALHFSTVQIQDLLNLWRDDCRHSFEVKQLATQHMNELNLKIRQMQNMVDLLQQTVECCAGNQEADCPILEKLENGCLFPTCV